jgi:hypothetical protein
MANEDTAPEASAVARAPDDGREAIEKAMHIISFDDVPQTNAREQEQKRIAGLFSEASALEPPCSLDELGTRVECSNILRQCIDAMVTNCGRLGYRPAAQRETKIVEVEQILTNVGTEETPRLQMWFRFSRPGSRQSLAASIAHSSQSACAGKPKPLPSFRSDGWIFLPSWQSLSLW